MECIRSRLSLGSCGGRCLVKSSMSEELVFNHGRYDECQDLVPVFSSRDTPFAILFIVCGKTIITLVVCVFNHWALTRQEWYFPLSHR